MRFKNEKYLFLYALLLVWCELQSRADYDETTESKVHFPLSRVLSQSRVCQYTVHVLRSYSFATFQWHKLIIVTKKHKHVAHSKMMHHFHTFHFTHSPHRMHVSEVTKYTFPLFFCLSHFSPHSGSIRLFSSSFLSCLSGLESTSRLCVSLQLSDLF